MSMISVATGAGAGSADHTPRPRARAGDRLGWKPHDKSMSLGQLALHVATVPGAIAEISRQSPFPLPRFSQPSPTRRRELIPAFEQSVAKAQEILRGMDDAALGKIWRAVDGEKEVMAMPVGASADRSC